MKSKRVRATVAAAGAAVALSASSIAVAPASAGLLDTLFGSLGGNTQPSPQGPNKPAPNTSSNGVRTIVVTTSNYHSRKLGPNLYSTGSIGYSYSARDASNAEVKGSNCQMEVTFSGPDTPATSKSANCQGSVGNVGRFRTAGKYTLTVTDRVSGAVGSASFTVE